MREVPLNEASLNAFLHDSIIGVLQEVEHVKTGLRIDTILRKYFTLKRTENLQVTINEVTDEKTFFKKKKKELQRKIRKYDFV